MDRGTKYSLFLLWHNAKQRVHPKHVAICIYLILLVASGWFYIGRAVSTPIKSSGTISPTLSACIEHFSGLGELPPVKSPNLHVPFFVLPEPLPTDGTTWSSCYLDNMQSKTHNKKLWGYYAVSQLENHRWRVDHPEKALIFVAPWFDFGGGENKPFEVSAVCKDLFVSVEVMMDRLTSMMEIYPQMNHENTVIFLGSYMRRLPYTKWITEMSSKSGGVRFPTASFTSAISRLAKEPYQHAMPVNVDGGICFKGSVISHFEDEGRRLGHCDALQHTLEQHAHLDTVDWLSARPFKYQSVGKFDNRSDYDNRRYLLHAMNEMVADNSALHSEALHPSITMYYHQRRDSDGELEDLNSGGDDACRREIASVSAAKSILSVAHSGLYCGGGMDRQWHSSTEDYPEFDWEMKLFSRMVLSLRGDSLGSQRSHEGMYYGAITWHDQPLQLMGLSILPMPNHVPWLLTGFFDEAGCLNDKSIAYKKDFKKYFSIQNGKKQFNRNHVPQSILADASAQEAEMLECIRPSVVALETDIELTTLMRKVVHHYRDDVLWETPNSRMAENMIFEFASDLSEDELQSFSLSQRDFEPRVPLNCTANTMETLSQVRGRRSADAMKYLQRLGDYDQIIGSWGRKFGA